MNEVIIYADVLFVVNFFINYIILLLTSAVLHIKYKIRPILGALFGAVYSTIIFFPKLGFLNLTILKIILSIAIVLISIKINTPLIFIKALLTFYGISFALGGMIFALYFFTAGGSFIKIQNGIPYFDISIITVLIASVIFFILLQIVNYIYTHTKNKIFRLKLTLGEKSCYINSMYDSGNLLCHPISHLPVITAEKASVIKLIPEKAKLIFENEPEFNEFNFSGLSVIPYNTINGSYFMFCIMPDKIECSNTKKEIKAEIGIINQKISKNKYYDSLIGFIP